MTDSSQKYIQVPAGLHIEKGARWLFEILKVIVFPSKKLKYTCMILRFHLSRALKCICEANGLEFIGIPNGSKQKPTFHSN